jgi:hypothetical protein
VKASSRLAVPPGVCTVTETGPAGRAGAVALIVVSVTAVPPAVGPARGLSCTRVGAGMTSVTGVT